MSVDYNKQYQAIMQLKASPKDTTVAELLQFYNDLPGVKKLNKFASKAAAFTKIIGELKKHIDTDAVSDEKPATVTTTKSNKKEKVMSKADQKQNEKPAPKEAKPKFGTMYSFSRQKDVQVESKSKLVNGKLQFKIVGKNGDDNLLRDRLLLKVVGVKDPVAVITCELGENGKQILTHNDVQTEVQLDTVCENLQQIIDATLEASKAEREAAEAEKAKAREEAKAKKEAEAAEKKRLREEAAAEKKRLKEEAKAEMLALVAEKKRLKEEAKAKKEADAAEKKRLKEEAKAKKEADAKAK